MELIFVNRKMNVLKIYFQSSALRQSLAKRFIPSNREWHSLSSVMSVFIFPDKISCLLETHYVQSFYMKTVLSIAGSDPSGGAGIQADLKTFCAYKVYGMAAITALTSQNTVGVDDVYPVPSACLIKQLDAIHEDLRIDAIKIGMLGTMENVGVISRFLEDAELNNVVLDPVLISTSGWTLLEEDAIRFLKESLFKRCTLVTPNLAEATILTGIKVRDVSSMKEAAKALFIDTGIKNVLIKGGHLEGKAIDILFDGAKFEVYDAPRVHKVAHGTGCTMSAAIAAGLARGFDIKEAVAKAKDYVLKGIKSSFDDIGKGSPPLNHFVHL